MTEAAPVVATTNGATNGTVALSKENELHYTFENYHTDFFNSFVKIKDNKSFNDGSLVAICEGKRKRFPLNISAFAVAIPKLNRDFYQAKRKMMESGFMNNTIDLQLPDFRQEGSSTAETAVRIIFDFVFQGRFEVSALSIKNVAVLASYLKIDSILEQLPASAEQLGFANFNMDELKKIGSSFGPMSIVGLEKFVNVFGGGKKAGQKRAANKAAAAAKQEPEVKKSRPIEEPVPESEPAPADSTQTKEEVKQVESDEFQVMESESVSTEVDAEKPDEKMETETPLEDPVKADEPTEEAPAEEAPAEAAPAEAAPAEAAPAEVAPAEEAPAEEAPAEETPEEPEVEQAATRTTRGRGKGAGRGRRGGKAKRGTPY